MQRLPEESERQEPASWRRLLRQLPAARTLRPPPRLRGPAVVGWAAAAFAASAVPAAWRGVEGHLVVVAVPYEHGTVCELTGDVEDRMAEVVRYCESHELDKAVRLARYAALGDPWDWAGAAVLRWAAGKYQWVYLVNWGGERLIAPEAA